MSNRREFAVPTIQTFIVDTYIIDACMVLNQHGEAISAIKLIRAHCNLGLKESKDINDMIRQGNTGKLVTSY